tara:strand:- start:584 stop:1993 length:1410 start_codon:yes stop_codon:yes gene_type:complete
MVTKAIPDSPDNLREYLDDSGKAEHAFKDAASAFKFIEAYRKATNLNDPELSEQAHVAKSLELTKWLNDQGYVKADDKARSGRVPMDASVAGQGGLHRGNKAIYNHLGLSMKQMRQIAATGGQVAGAGMFEAFDSLGDFGLAAFRSIFEKGFSDERVKDLSVAVPGDGGFLVPEEFRAELLMLGLEASVVRSRANVIPMGTPTIRWPAIRDASHASSVFGGVVGAWVAEGGTVSSSTNQPSFSAVRLSANKLTAYSVVSNELRADSAISIEGLISSLYPQALNYFEDDAFINGTGAGQPMGIINADAMVQVAKESGQAATTIVWENLLNMYSRMHPASLGNAVWMAHMDTFPQLATMSLNVGTGGSAIWLGNGVSGPPVTILGRPVVFTEKAQTLGTAGDISFIDFSQYLIGDRQALTMAASDHVLFTTDEHAIRLVQRLDGRPWLITALTPRNGSNTVSPYVNLATRS